MSYSKEQFVVDAVRYAQSQHLAYVRAKFLLNRWYSGINGEIPNDATVVGGYPGTVVNNVVSRLSEQITDYEASTSAKLNTILAASGLTLPGVGE